MRTTIIKAVCYPLFFLACLVFFLIQSFPVELIAQKYARQAQQKTGMKLTYEKITTLFPKITVNPRNTVAATCGPPIMIKFVIQNLEKLGFTDDQIFTTLEMRMKCGIGKCGRCNIGNLYVCKDGPVFSYKQLKNIQGER